MRDENDIADLSRSEVIVKGALAVGAVYGISMVGPLAGRLEAMSSGGDVGILNFTLAFEYSAASFYGEARTRVRATGGLKSLVGLLAEEEEEHVVVLTSIIKQLGGTPPASPSFHFPYHSTEEFLGLAQTLEDTAISAYNGVMPKIKSKDVLRTVAAIVQVEARHSAAIRLRNGQEPAPEGFDFPRGKTVDLKTISPFVQ